MKGKTFFVLLVVALLTVGLVWVMAQVLSAESAGPVPSQPAVEWDGIGLPISLEGAVRRAEARVMGWQADAMLVRVDGTWRPGVERLDRQVLPIPWSLYYYSPSARQLASAVVDAEHVFWVPPLPMRDGRPAEVVPFPPAYEPRQVWLTFKGAGGEEFIRTHPDAVVTLTLRMEEGRAIWQVRAFSEGHFMQVKIDAETGLVLP